MIHLTINTKNKRQRLSQCIKRKPGQFVGFKNKQKNKKAKFKKIKKYVDKVEDINAYTLKTLRKPQQL